MNESLERRPAEHFLIPLDALLAVLMSISFVMLTLSFEALLENHLLWEVICFLLPAVIILLVRQSFIAVFSPIHSSGIVFFIALFVLLSSTVLGLGLGGIIDNLFDVSEISKEIQKEIGMYPFFEQIFLFAVLPAVCEEVLFRGVILNSLKSTGKKNAVIITSLIFAVFHGSIELFLPILVVSLALSLIGLQKGGLLLAIICHFLHNFINLLLMNFYDADLALAPSIIISAAGLALMIISLRFLKKVNGSLPLQRES
jgi:uncharacterized protein